ncbi:four helix bundle protein [bacterium]|nr:four helix bundle protein [bacterium]
MQISEGECSETQYWLEVIVEADMLPWQEVRPDYDECSEILAIFT